MIEFLNEVINMEKPWLFMPDTIENIMDDLEHYTLDPRFEEYGNFVNRNPQWINEEIKEKYNGCVVVFGNFYTLSHAFRLITDDIFIINMLQSAIDNNKQTEAYKQAKIDIKKAEDEYKKEVMKRIEKANKRRYV